MYDAVQMYSRAIREASVSRKLDTQVLSCNKPEVPWTEGDSLMNVIRSVRGLVEKLCWLSPSTARRNNGENERKNV